MSKKNNNAMNTAVAIVSLLIVVAIIGFVFKFTNGLNEELKTFYIEHNGKQIVASDSTITFETKSEHRFDCKYISAPEDSSFSVKVVPNITKDKETDFSYTVNDEPFNWSEIKDITSCFNINKQANYFIISFPEDFSIENVLNSYHQDKEVVIVDDILIYQYYFTLVVSNYNESITFNIHFNVNDYSNYLEIIQTYIDEISLLNAQIKEKDDDILELNEQINSLNNDIDNCIADKETLIVERNNLNNEKNNLLEEIAQLEKSIEYYETCLSQFEIDDTVIISLEVDGSIYSIFTMAKGSNMFNIVLPDTDNYKFNGWKVNDESVDLNGYIVNESTTFVADLTYTTYYTVTFKVDDDIYSTQKVLANSTIQLPENPAKDGYYFQGWSLDGETVITPSLNNISSDIIYIALFSGELSSISIYDFNITLGSGNNIWSDGENTYYSLLNTQYVLNKENNTWKAMSWNIQPDTLKLWSAGENIYSSYEGVNYILDKENYSWIEKSWNGLTSFSGYFIWTDGENIYYSASDEHYILNKETSTWNKKTWNGLTSFSGTCIWTDGENIYYSASDEHYILNKETSTWIEKSWNGLTSFSGYFIWTDGNNIYSSSEAGQYVLDKETDTWEIKVWSGQGDLAYADILYEFSGEYVWTDGENYYYTSGNKTYKFS